MKTIMQTSTTLVKLTALLLIVLSFSSFNRKKDCNPLVLLDEAMKKLKKFTMVKDYPFNFKKTKKGKPESMDQMVMLNRGVRYKFFAIENKEFDGKPIVAIYNNEKKEFLVACTYATHTKQFYEEIEFECKTTGNYCLSFYFQEGEEGCAVGVHSFLK